MSTSLDSSPATITKKLPAKLHLATAKPVPVTLDLRSHELYLNRELSWLKFNWRVLNEAADERLPLLERVKFLAIVGSNLDEFCMKRIGGLYLQLHAGVKKLSVDGLTPRQQIDACEEEISQLRKTSEHILAKLLSKLKRENICVSEYCKLDENDKAWLDKFYTRDVHPLLTPQAIDISHPFPFISNLSLNLYVTLLAGDQQKTTPARIKIPVGEGLPRFVRLPSSADRTRNEFVAIEDLVLNNLEALFPHTKIVSSGVFRVTRNANSDKDHSGAADLVEMIRANLRDRKFAPVVRLEVSSSMQETLREKLTADIGITDQHTMSFQGSLLGMADLMELGALNMPALSSPIHHGVENASFVTNRKVFSQIRLHGSILLQHPYECFKNSVERFIKEASTDPKVKTIKMTIYRTSTDSSVVEHLITAARNGKQVAVVVELTASFEEKRNIQWAQRLEQYGIHVSYGIFGLKTHCKVILVVRKEGTRLARYYHVGTGNYHARNAKIYSDFGVLGCDPGVGSDVTELFNYLTTGCASTRAYQNLLTAPLYIKKSLIEKIQREIEHANRGNNAYIRLKTNALEDPDIIHELYRASMAGVQIDLIIRDICRLRPQIANLSENINVISIVGQFLEHGRIYHFYNNGDEEYFIGSADLMSRNLERRVEVLLPIKQDDLRVRLAWILDVQLSDQRCAWDMHSDGSYTQRIPPQHRGKEELGCHQAFVLQSKNLSEANITKKTVQMLQETRNG